MGGSAKAAGAGDTYDVFGSIVGLICPGPVDELFGIEVDDDLVWEGRLLRGVAPNPARVSVSGYGDILFFWGTEDQLTTPDILTPLRPDTNQSGGLIPRFIGNDLNQEHPAYTGWCYAVPINFLFGQEREAPPQFRFRVRRKPAQQLITGLPAGLIDGQANPIAVIAELLTSERAGLGWPLSRFDQANWQAAAERAHERHQLTAVSMLLSDQKEARAAIEDLLDMVDGFLRFNRITGLVEVCLYSPAEEIDPDTLPLITSVELVGVAEIKYDTWEDVPTRWRCSYRDRDKNFKERSLKHDDPRARFAAGLKRPETLRRNLIVREAQAKAHLQEWARRFGVPGCSGTLSVRGARYATLQPGDRVRTDIDPEPGGKQLRQVFRVTEVTRRKKGELKLKVEAERTLAPALAEPEIEEPPAPEPKPAVPAITSARFIECPPALADNVNFAVAALASRPSGIVVDFCIYYDNNPGDLFPQLGDTRAFALRARLTQPLAASDAPQSIFVEVTDEFGRETLDENPGETAARDDTLLAILIKSDPEQGGQIKADAEGKAWIEVLSCIETTAADEDVLEVSALRARRGTPGRAFAAGDEVWFIRRAQLAVLTHADFAQLAANDAPAYFKLQPGERARQRPLEDCAPWTFSFALARDLPVIADAWHLEYRYRFQDIKPYTPSAVDAPAGWTLDRPETGSGVLWSTSARKRDGSNKLIGNWSEPVRVSGRRIFYQPTAPIRLTADIIDGDWWFNTADNNKQHRWNAATQTWVGIFGLEADAFFVEDGITYVKEQAIQKITAGKITSGTIESAHIVLAGENARITTDDYEPGVAGSMFNGKGAEFDRIIVRDTIITGSLGAMSLSPSFGQFDETMPVNISAPTGLARICYTLDGRPPGPLDAQWPVNENGFAALIINATTRLCARGFDLNGRMTSEVDALYLKNVYQADIVVISVAIRYNSSGQKAGFVVNLSCATPGRKIFFRVDGFAGQSWKINAVGGLIVLGGGRYSTSFYEWNESLKEFDGYGMRSVPPVQVGDSGYPSLRIWAYAVVGGMANSVTNVFTYDPSGRNLW